MTTLERAAAGPLARLSGWWLGLSRPGRVSVTVLTTALAALAVYWWAHVVVGPHHHQFDLAIYYRAVNFWTSGNELYDYAQPDPVNISLGFTYPPLAAVLMTPMATLPFDVVSAITVTLIVLAAAACVGLLLRERITLPRGLWPMAIGLVTAAAFLLEPMRQTIGFGQVNAFLMLLVLVDLLVLVPRGSRFAGIGVGLALAIKLTPGIFLLYLLLGRHWRPLITAVLSAAAVTVLAAAVASAESWRFFTSLLFDNGRVGFVGSSANQSINGLLARFVAPDAPSTAVWIAVAVVVLAAGAWRIRAAIAADDRLLAVTLTGLVGVLVSPVSWPHHIVWAMPAVIVLGAWLGRSAVDLAAQRRAGHGPTGRQLRRLAGPVTLVLTGLLIWGCDTRILFGLPDVDYSGRGPVAILLGSLPMFWVLAAVLVLPTGTRIGVDPAISPARPAAVRPAS